MKMLITKIKKLENNLNFRPCFVFCQTAGVVLQSTSLFLNPSLMEWSYEFSSVCMFLHSSVTHFLWNPRNSFFRYWEGVRVPPGLKRNRG